MSVEEKAARARSMAIDQQIELDSRLFRREIKVLLLGAPGSGKSAIISRIQKTQCGGYDFSDLVNSRLVIYTNLVHLAKEVIWTMRKIGVDCVEEINRTGAEKILGYEVGSDPSFRLAPDVADAIESLWKDPVIATVMDQWPHYSDSDLLDSASYFFSHVQRIAQRDYYPYEEDVLNARATTSGIVETRFHIGALSLRVFDTGGLSSERKKWIRCFEAVPYIFFCAPLSNYDHVLSEDCQQTRMTESLALFESVVNSPWFSTTSIVLFLTKINLFKAKLPEVPMDKYFPEYTGGSDINNAAKYILWRYAQANRARLSIYPHLTRETDTSDVRQVLAAVKETVLQDWKALGDSGIL